MITWLILSNLILFTTRIIAEIPTQSFNGYDYPKPSIPFNHGYSYNKPSCPLNIATTSYITVPITETSIVVTTLPPVISTEFITLPKLTDYLTQTLVQTLTTTSTTTKFRIQPTTLTSYITSSYCAPRTYLPPAPPANSYLPAATRPPPTPTNQYLPANQRRQQPQFVEQTTPNTFLQSFAFGQAGPIKRMASDVEVNRLRDSREQIGYGSTSSSDQSQTNISVPPAISIIYLDRTGTDAKVNVTFPAADLMNWLLCRFSLVNQTCLN